MMASSAGQQPRSTQNSLEQALGELQILQRRNQQLSQEAERLLASTAATNTVAQPSTAKTDEAQTLAQPQSPQPQKQQQQQLVFNGPPPNDRTYTSTKTLGKNTVLYVNLCNRFPFVYPRQFTMRSQAHQSDLVHEDAAQRSAQPQPQQASSQQPQKTHTRCDQRQVVLENGRVTATVTMTAIPDDVFPDAHLALIARDAPHRLYIFSTHELTEQLLVSLDSLYGLERYPIVELSVTHAACTNSVQTIPRVNHYQCNGAPSSVREFVEYRYLQQRYLLTNIAYDRQSGRVHRLVLPSRPQLVLIMPGNFVRTALKSGYFHFAENNLIVRVFSRYMLSSPLLDEGEHQLAAACAQYIIPNKYAISTADSSATAWCKVAAATGGLSGLSGGGGGGGDDSLVGTGSGDFVKSRSATPASMSLLVSVIDTDNVCLRQTIELFFSRMNLHRVVWNGCCEPSADGVGVSGKPFSALSNNQMYAYDKYLTMVVGELNNVALPDV